ncbi:MAG: hypothetical protein FVQ84_08520 [Planctomycetes bacterium]|nr:hypothetical protein [Planctomycetota bacterium]
MSLTQIGFPLAIRFFTPIGSFNTSVEDINNTIRTRFKVNVSDVRSLTTHHDNAPFTIPATGLWCRFSVLPGESKQVSLGRTKRYRIPGVAIAQLFDDIEIGDKNIIEEADFIREEFTSVTDTSVTFRSPTISKPSLDGKNWSINVNIPWFADIIG